MRVIVVGAGLMGLATARALQRAGHRPVLLDRGPIPNPLASSMDRHRAIRFAYGAAKGYARMVAEAYPAWDRLWADLGQKLLVETGHLTLGEPDDPWIAASRASMTELGVPFEEPAPAEIARRHPVLAAARIPYALLAARGGVLLADRIVGALAARLASEGAEVQARTEVADLDPERAAVRLADGRVIGGDALLVTAGAWTPRLVPGLARRLTPSRQVVVYVAPPDHLRAAWQATPVLSDIDSVTSTIFYALPPVPGAGLKFGDHRFSLGGDPDAGRTPRPDEIASILALAGRRLADADGYRVEEGRSCFYTVTEDERFLAHREGKALVLSACSGHGFKFGALIGERTAQCLAGGLDFTAFRQWLGGEAVLQAGTALL